MERYVMGQVSEHESRKIEAWLDAIGSENHPHFELTPEEEDRIFQKLTDRMTTVEEVAAFVPKRRWLFPGWAVPAAACLMLIAALSLYFYANQTIKEPTLPTVKSDVEKIILDDGSLVWLDATSKISYYERPLEGTRHARLEGDALFEIAKDANHPFIVECSGIRIRVVGTSFAVKTEQDQVEVTVLTGRVNLSTATDSIGLDLTAKEKGIYKGDGILKKSSADTAEIALLSDNEEYAMHFNNTALHEVLERLGRKFNVTVRTDSDKIRDCRITIDLTDQSLENSLRLIGDVLDISYTINNRIIKITGSGCNS
jgi:ferric-dicitrate binding protein FerR (iron transport regulator)